MLELHVREFLRDLEKRIHVAEARREDELVALLREVAQHAFGVGVFGNVLKRRHLNLVAELGFDGLAGDVVLRRPAFFVGRAHVNEGNLEGPRRSGGGSGRLGCIRSLLRGGGLRFFLAAGREHQGGGAGERELEGIALLHEITLQSKEKMRPF